MKIQQTTLTIDDIAEHRELLRILYETDEQKVDDMLVRFAMTFTEGYEPESEVTG